MRLTDAADGFPGIKLQHCLMATFAVVVISCSLVAVVAHLLALIGFNTWLHAFGSSK